MKPPSMLRCLTVGVSCGLRVFTAVSITAAAAKSPWTTLAASLAAGELGADKLPQAPDRIAPLGLGARAVSGALCGAAIARSAHRSWAGGALAGSAAALGAAFAGFYVRRSIVRAFHVPDAIVATIEDGIAFGLARFANG